MICKVYFTIENNLLNNIILFKRDESIVLLDENIDKYDIENASLLDKYHILYSFESMPYFYNSYLNDRISIQTLEKCCSDKKMFLSNLTILKDCHIDKLIDYIYNKNYEFIYDSNKIECLELLNRNFMFLVNDNQDHPIFKNLNIEHDKDYKFVNIKENWSELIIIINDIKEKIKKAKEKERYI